MDIVSLAHVVSTIKNASDIARLIRDSGSTLEAAQQKLKLADLIALLADLKLEMSDVQEQIRTRDQKIRELEDQLKTQDSVEWQQPYYWTKNESGRDGPFCQQCYDKEKRLIRLQTPTRGFWQCKACKNDYMDDSYSPGGPDILSVSSSFRDHY